jgi:vancomycin aglycone glucosyltransferase
MRVLVSASGSRGCVEPVMGPAVRLRARGAEVRVCAPPDAEVAARRAGVGGPPVPLGQPVRPLVHGSRVRSAAHGPRRAAAVIAAPCDTVAAAAADCEAPVATCVTPAGGWR